MKYSIKILADKDFDNLPYKDTETSLGIADPKTNTAYVRYTNIKDVDKYLIGHELDHLIDGADKSHFKNGVYYKNFSQLLSPVSSMINAGASAIGKVGSAGANIGRGVGSAVGNAVSKSLPILVRVLTSLSYGSLCQYASSTCGKFLSTIDSIILLKEGFH